jgi:phosphatidylglycerol:prolipoprotein diacylglycerol transferase
LFRIPWFGGSIPYHAYGFFLAVAFLLGMSLCVRDGRKEGLAPNHVVSIVFIAVITSLLGSRLMHLLMADREAFFADPGVFFRFSSGGYAFYGGFIAANLATWIYCRVQRLSFLHVVDVFAPPVAFGLVFGRIGCLLAGCCHGRPIDQPLPDWLFAVIPVAWPSWFAVTFPSVSGGLGGLLDQPLVPTQPLSQLYNLAIFLLLALVVTPRKRYHGQVFVWLIILYAIARSTVELLRGDDRGMYFGEALSTSQLVSVPVILVGVGILLWARSRLASGKLQPLADNWRQQACLALPPHDRPDSSGLHADGSSTRKKKKRRH